MSETDFTTALGRLLSDAALREAFRVNRTAVAAQLSLRAEDNETFAALEPAELEAQAQVLVRKRLDVIRCLLPQTCGRLQDKLHRQFHEHARAFWPMGSNMEAQDALAFAQRLQELEPGALCRAELNRARFAVSSDRLRVCFSRDVVVRGRARSAWQIFVRTPRGRWFEWVIFLGW